MTNYKLNLPIKSNLSTEEINYFETHLKASKNNVPYRKKSKYFQIYLISKDALNEDIDSKKAQSNIEKILTEIK